MFEMTKEGSVRGKLHGVRSTYLEALDDEVLRTLVAESKAMPPGPISMVQIRVLGGAMARVAEEATAFAHRDKQAMVTLISSWEDPAESILRHAWIDRVWRALRPYEAGVYVNFLEDEGDARIRAAYKPATYRRLAALKKQYDPANIFRRNQNIKPDAQLDVELPESEKRAA